MNNGDMIIIYFLILYFRDIIIYFVVLYIINNLPTAMYFEYMCKYHTHTDTYFLHYLSLGFASAYIR